MAGKKVKLTTPGSQPLSVRRDTAQTEDCPFQTAGAEDTPLETPRRQVLEALEESLLQYDELYRKLAQ